MKHDLTNLWIAEWNPNNIDKLKQFHVQPLLKALETNRNQFLNGYNNPWIPVLVADSREEANRILDKLIELKINNPEEDN
jgi:hypothetical protein